MKKFLFVAVACVVVTVSSCTKDSSVAPAKTKTNVAIGPRDTISNELQIVVSPGGKK